jgi:hypothetical protein
MSDFERLRELPKGGRDELRRLGGHGHLDDCAFADPGDQVQRLESVELVLECPRLGVRSVVAEEVEGVAGRVQRVRGGRLGWSARGAGRSRRP